MNFAVAPKGRMPADKEKASLARVELDYNRMRPWLPEVATAILDIGCGYAHIDVWLARHYGGNIDVHLMDADADVQQIRKEHAGFNPRATAWRSRHHGIEVLQRLVPECRVHGYKPDARATIPCDIIVSRRSWGHHYPIKKYIGLAERSLRPGGRIITDVRLGQDGVETFEAHGFSIISPNVEPLSIKCAKFVFARD